MNGVRDKQRILGLYDAGFSMEETAEMTLNAPHKVRQFLIVSGANIRSPGIKTDRDMNVITSIEKIRLDNMKNAKTTRKNKPNGMTRKQKASAISLYNEGISINEISKILSCPPETTRRYLIKKNVHVPNTKNSNRQSNERSSNNDQNIPENTHDHFINNAMIFLNQIITCNDQALDISTKIAEYELKIRAAEILLQSTSNERKYPLSIPTVYTDSNDLQHTTTMNAYEMFLNDKQRMDKLNEISTKPNGSNNAQ